LLYLLKVEFAEKQLEALPPQAELSLLAALWDNQGFRKYLSLREDYLIRAGMESFIAGSVTTPNRFAGQLIEVRELTTRARNAYRVIHPPKPRT